MNDNILIINKEYQELEDKIGELYEQIQSLRNKQSTLKVTSALKKNIPYHFKHWFEENQDWYGIVHDLWYDRTDDKYVFEFCGFCGEFDENDINFDWYLDPHAFLGILPMSKRCVGVHCPICNDLYIIKDIN